MAKKKQYVSAGYEVGFKIDNYRRYEGHARFKASASIVDITAGFWLDDDYRPAALGKERYFVMPHMITYIRKDYRSAGSET